MSGPFPALFRSAARRPSCIPDEKAGVLDEQRPAAQPGTVYQMWLVSEAGATSAGTMDAAAVSVDYAVLPNLGDSRQPRVHRRTDHGSTTPSGPFIAELPIA